MSSDQTATRIDDFNELMDSLKPMIYSQVAEANTDEELYIRLYYSLLFSLAHHPSQPVVQLYSNAQIQLLDAFLAGSVMKDGDITQEAVERDAKGKLEFMQMRDELVPNLIPRIKEQVDKNFQEEEKNHVDPDTNSAEHDELWKITITPRMVKKYRKFLDNGDLMVKVERPDEFAALWNFLGDIVEAQYDFEAWVHVSSLKHPEFNQQLHLITEDKKEEFQAYAADPSKIFAYTRVVIPGTNEIFSQVDLIPKARTSPAGGDDDDDSDDTPTAYSEKNYYFVPSIDSIVVPEKARKNHTPWEPIDNAKRDWKRADGATWTCKVLVREFNSKTDQYIRPRLLQSEWVQNIDPNDKTWIKRYNQHWRQLERRRTGTKLVTREHWDERERAVLYKLINSWCKEHGVDQFQGSFGAKLYRDIAVAVSKVRGITRSIDSVRGQIETAHANKNKEIFELRQRAQGMKVRIDNGETIEKSEQFPSTAIEIQRTMSLVVKLRIGAENLPGESSASLAETKEIEDKDDIARDSDHNDLYEDP